MIDDGLTLAHRALRVVVETVAPIPVAVVTVRLRGDGDVTAAPRSGHGVRDSGRAGDGEGDCGDIRPARIAVWRNMRSPCCRMVLVTFAAVVAPSKPLDDLQLRDL